MSTNNIPFVTQASTVVVVDGSPVVHTTIATAESLEAFKGILATSIGSAAAAVIPAGTDGYVLSASSTALYGVNWVPPSSGGGGATLYQLITTDAETLGISGVNAIDISGLGAGSFTGNVPNGNIAGDSIIVVMLSITPGSTYTVNISLTNGTTATFDTVGQGFTVYWTGASWSLSNGGAIIA
jgi:hypothetical protein